MISLQILIFKQPCGSRRPTSFSAQNRQSFCFYEGLGAYEMGTSHTVREKCSLVNIYIFRAKIFTANFSYFFLCPE